MRRAGILSIMLLAAAVSCSSALAMRADEHRILPIANGRLGDRFWFAAVSGNDPKKDVSAPCAVIVLRDASPGGSPETEFTEDATSVCGVPSATEPPMVVSVGVDEKTPKEGAVFVILADRKVASVKLFLAGGGSRVVPLKRLVGQRAKRTGVGPLRYGAFGKRGSQCVRRTVSLDAAGRWILATPLERCSRVNG